MTATTPAPGDAFPDLGGTFFNPKTAVAWIEQQPTETHAGLACHAFRGLLENAARPKQTSGNACAKLCGFVEQCSKSTSAALVAFALAEETALELFDFFIEWNEQDQHRAMRAVLDLLRTIFCSNPDQARAESTKLKIVSDSVAMVTLQSTRPSAKSALTVLDHFLQKKLVFLSQVLGAYRGVHQIPQDQDVPWQEFVAKIFAWMELQHVCPVAAKFLVTIFTTPWDKTGNDRFHPEAWHKFLCAGLEANIEFLEPVKLYVLMPLFKCDRDQAVKYLADLFALQSITTQGQTDLDLNSTIWLAALEAGKKTGVVGEPITDSGAEPQQQSASHLQANVLEDILCHSSHEARSSAVSILIASSSTSRPYSSQSLDLLREHLPAFYADNDAKFRYDVLGHSRNMIRRILGAMASLRKDEARGLKRASKTTIISDVTSALKHHEAFVRWYLGFLKQELVPTASYQRHITALKAMESILHSQVLQLQQPDQPDFLPNLLDESWLRAVLDLIMDPFDDVRETAASLLTILRSVASKHTQPVVIAEPFSKFHLELEEFCRRANTLASRTSRADHSDGVARSYKLLCHWSGTTQEKLQVPSAVIADLESRLLAAEKDLAVAVLDTPIHGTFAAVRYIWEALSNNKYSHEELQTLLALQSRAVLCCHRVWQVVRHVLCDDSPEGHLPEELEEVEGLDTKDLLSYSFRAIHESSNLLRAIANNAPSHGKAGLLAPDEETFRRIGNLTFDELSNLRHRGAFSTVSHTFTGCCQRVGYYVSPGGEADTLLDQWYKGALDCIYSQASTTRRSAGIPALIVGILSANAERPSLRSVMRDLRRIAQEPALIARTDGSDLPQVHALNCIKDVFKSSFLSKRAEEHLTESLQLAATSLKSEIWAIRNCGLILLRSLIDNLFGTNEGKTLMEAGWDGRTTKIAWHKYKNLPAVIVNLLESGQQTANSAKSTATAESVFPALDIIRRAGPPEEFKDLLFGLVARYLGSPIWHVREIAARTLCSFLLKPDWIQRIRELLNDSLSSANKLHGAFLTLKSLLERLQEVMPEQLHGHLQPASDLLVETSQISDAFQTSSEVRAVYFEIVAFINSVRKGDAAAQLIEPQLSQAGAPEKTMPRAVSALLASKHAEAHLEFEVRRANTHGDAKNLRLDSLWTGDVNVACDVLERMLSYDAPVAGNLSLAQQVVTECMAVCLNTDAPEPRTLALEVFSAQMDAILASATDRDSLLPSRESLCNLWHDLQRKPLNPGLADAIVQASGALLATVMLQSTMPPQHDVQQWLRSWGVMMSHAGLADKTFDSRMAAALALRSYSRHAHVAEGHGSQLPWLLALYDALNDDDDEVREVAAMATKPILGKSLVSMEASSKLLGWLTDRFGASTEFRNHVACRLAGRSPIASTLTEAALAQWTPAAEQLASAMRFDDALFAVEEQNLYIDEVREAQRWRAVWAKMPGASTAAPAADAALARWTRAGLQALAARAANDDGVLGWASKPDVFAIGARVAACASALAAADPDVRAELLRFREAGKQTRTHGLWLSMCEVE